MRWPSQSPVVDRLMMVHESVIKLVNLAESKIVIALLEVNSEGRKEERYGYLNGLRLYVLYGRRKK